MKSSYSLCKRELVRFYRQRSRIIGTLGAPFLFWIFLGAGLSSSLPALNTPGGHGYLEYFFPGNLLLTVLFTSIFSSISLIEDKREGFLQGVLVAPLPRSSIVLGKICGGSLIALLQGLLFCLAAPLVGFSLTLPGIAIVILSMAALSLCLTAIGFFFAWRFDSIQGFHSVMNLLLFPMWLLSGAFFSASQAAWWIKPLMYLNPLTYGLDALRTGLYWGGSEIPPVILNVSGSISVVLVVGALATLAASISLSSSNKLREAVG